MNAMESEMRALDLDSGLVAWEGAVSVERRDGWHKAWRVPYQDAELFPPAALNGKAEASTGVRLSFKSDARTVTAKMLPSEAAYKLDVVCGGELAATQHLRADQTEVTFRDLPEGEKHLEIYLPQQEFRLTGLEVDDEAIATAFEDSRARWIAYGSSITNCAAAASPAQTWPALVARSKDLHLTCLGFGGNCHAEPMVARMIRDLPADAISLCLGINIYGGNSLGPRTFQAAVIGFIKVLRDGHPHTPITVASPILSPPRETTPNGVGLTLVEMRSQIQQAVDMLVRRGDTCLHYLDGLQILGPDDAARLPDDLHPDAQGYRLMAQRFERLSSSLF